MANLYLKHWKKQMKIHNLCKVDHKFKTGMKCPDIEPNIFEDTLFLLDEKPVGFFIRKINPKMQKIANFADCELRSERVPKGLMTRSSSYKNNNQHVAQYSVIIGGVPSRPQARRPYPNVSSVHRSKAARGFIRAMKYLAQLTEELISQHMPEQHSKQIQILDNAIEPRLRFSKMFTSSISNYNISAPFHQDNGNLKNTVNAIINKKFKVSGGNLYVPDFNLVFDGCDNSLVVYPAWMSIHGVTPIHAKNKSGYRNSLVFYPYDLRK